MSSRDDKLDLPTIPVLDEAKLFGFERVDDQSGDAIASEAAVATAFSKRGEGPPTRQ